MRELFLKSLQAMARTTIVAGCAIRIALCASIAPVAIAQEPLGPQEALSSQSLQVKVSFEVKRQPLVELIADLQKQSGITLTAALDSPAEKVQVTARVHEMTLAEVMAALTRLYGVTWRPDKANANAYVMHGSDHSELEQKLLQVGDINVTENRSWKLVRQEATALTNMLPRLADPAALESKQGVLVAKLPQEFQVSLRDHMEKRQAGMVVKAYLFASESFLRDCVLRVRSAQPLLPEREPAVRGRIRLQPPPQMSIYSYNGEEIARLPFLPVASPFAPRAVDSENEQAKPVAATTPEGQ